MARGKGNTATRKKNEEGKGRPAPMTTPVGIKNGRRRYGSGGKLK